MNSILYIINVDRFFRSHRLPIAKAAIAGGFEVHLATHFNEDLACCQDIGLICHPLHISRSGQSPIVEIKTFFSILKTIKSIKPDLVHLVTIKPVIYGGIAARILGVRTVAAIPGLGSVFTGSGLTKKVIRSLVMGLYKWAIGGPKCHIIVQNQHDEGFLLQDLGIPRERVTLIPGSGVDLTQYPVKPEPEGPPIVVMASRLLFDKGVREFIEAAKIIKQSHPDVRFWLAGDLDPGNPSSLTAQDLIDIRANGDIEACGFVHNVAELFSSAHLVVLPSYREGLPKALIEASACGRAVVTTDAPGCSDAIIHQETGLLVPIKDARALSEAILSLLKNDTIRRQMGEKGRQLAEARYDIERVVAKHLEIYQGSVG